MAVPPHLDSTREDGDIPAVSPCAICGGQAQAPHLNCANVDCNKLFLACNVCRPKYFGCCCEACTSAPRLLRPIKKEGYYAKLHTYNDNTDANDNTKAKVKAAGASEGKNKVKGAITSKSRAMDKKTNGDAKSTVSVSSEA